MAAKRQHTAHSHSLLTVSYGPLYNFSTVIQCKKKNLTPYGFQQNWKGSVLSLLRQLFL